MIPDPLAPLFAPLTSLPGIGPALAERFARALGGSRVIDLLFHLPESYIDRAISPSLAAILPGKIASVTVQIFRHEPPATPRQPWRIVIGDDTGFAEIALFSRPNHPPAALSRLPIAARVLISGKAEPFNGRLTFSHPDHILPADQAADLPPLEPVWPLTAGLTTWHVRRAMAHALAALPTLPEWQDPALLSRESWPPFADALRAIQSPLAPPPPGAHARLAYDELLARQLAFGLSRRRDRENGGRAVTAPGLRRAESLRRFGHSLTPSQSQVLREIDADMAAPHRMLRLLQGDVGSGKTLVALLAMLTAAEAGYQAVLMAPTELLARQHLRTFRALTPITTELLTGSVKGAERRRILDGLETGRIQLVVGTHALFQSGVAFRDLALAVIDEQHRFGVDQRLLLSAKGALTDLLVMTATPIPRTLLLTHWGDMSISRLTGRPAGRPPIRTTLHGMASLPEIIAAVGRALATGSHVYWVCPLVRESEVLDIAAAEARFTAFRAHFGTSVGLVHGRQETAEREANLAAFAAGLTPLLVATTVVEVGVDVPAANIIVIDHAERFGLAQLHQLRGRVGRGTAASFCLLLHEDHIPDTARERLTLLRDTDDGFLIADKDFDLRGPGEALGTQQSGQIAYRLAHPTRQRQLLDQAHTHADYVLDRDPDLSGPNAAYRLLLRLFGREDAYRNIKAG